VASSSQVEVDGRELKLTNLDKVLYPKAGFSKGEVVDYYAKVAPAMVPHLSGRAVTLRRFPEGVDDTDAAFFEKRCPKHRPEWVKTTPVGASTGRIDFCVCEDRATLVWMAQLAAIELHPSLSLAPEHDRPTVLAFDLDPGPPAEVLSCCRVALRLRELFSHFGLECFPKTSGSKGLQVYAPLNNDEVTYEGDDNGGGTKPLARAIAQLLEKQTPDKVGLLPARPRTAHRLHSSDLGGGRTGGREGRRRLACLRGERRVEANRRARGPLRPRARSAAEAARDLAQTLKQWGLP
jgi:bifunctional non-homologous end joining protein LigD